MHWSLKPENAISGAAYATGGVAPQIPPGGPDGADDSDMDMDDDDEENVKMEDVL